MTFEQSYPQSKVEKNINQHSKPFANKSDVKFVDKLVTLIDVIRKTYFDVSNVDEIISTRRLDHISLRKRRSLMTK